MVCTVNTPGAVSSNATATTSGHARPSWGGVELPAGGAGVVATDVVEVEAVVVVVASVVGV